MTLAKDKGKINYSGKYSSEGWTTENINIVTGDMGSFPSELGTARSLKVRSGRHCSARIYAKSLNVQDVYLFWTERVSNNAGIWANID